MQKLHFLALSGNFGEVFPGVGPADLLGVSLRTGDAPPAGALPLLRGKGRTKTRPAAPPRHSASRDDGFPPLRRCFGAGQKLACGSNSLPGFIPKPPLRSGGSAREVPSQPQPKNKARSSDRAAMIYGFLPVCRCRSQT